MTQPPLTATAEVLFETRGSLLIVTFNRPDKGNAFTSFMAKLVSEKLKTIIDDRGIRAVLLRGQGDHFMNGHEMSVYAGDIAAVQNQVLMKVQLFYALIRDLHIMEKPVICALDGRVTGAGFNLMLASDICIASRRSIFNPSFTSYAMSPDGGVTTLLPRRIGLTRAMEMLMLNEDVPAETALQWGLINRVVEDQNLQAEALTVAERLAQGATRALGAAKNLVAAGYTHDLNAHLSMEASYWTGSIKTFDFRDAMKAYTAKTPMKFNGA